MALYTIADLAKARKLSRRRKFQGLDISVETQSGAYRHWYDPHVGRHGKTRMPHDYGYIRRTMGADGDHVDVYIGPDPDATHAYVIDQMRGPDFQIFDEQKIMLGFPSAGEAKAAYEKCYDKPGFFGQMRAVPMGEFRKQVLGTTKDSPLVKSRIMLRKAGGDVHLVHEIFEDATRGYPPVTHIFSGKDRREAQGYFDSHMETDAFMRGMERNGKFKGIAGSTKKRWVSGALPESVRKAAAETSLRKASPGIRLRASRPRLLLGRRPQPGTV